MWSNKEYVELLSKARALQLQLRFSERHQKGIWQIQFTDSLKRGRTTQAMRIPQKGSCLQGILDVHSEIDGRKVRDILVEKHPNKNTIRRLFDSACTTGTLSWITVIPNVHKGFFLSHKQFQDAMAIRYNSYPGDSLSYCRMEDCRKYVTKQPGI
ncbi:hypothetical protein GJ496_011748 [Pomphorhynchus laevis]|nr:hypothetical protein GJ496_011748 [Pomphorhynchus laevis]